MLSGSLTLALPATRKKGSTVGRTIPDDVFWPASSHNIDGGALEEHNDEEGEDDEEENAEEEDDDYSRSND